MLMIQFAESSLGYNVTLKQATDKTHEMRAIADPVA
jgi:hypothetical protein